MSGEVRIVFQGRPLRADSTLHSYGIDAGTTLTATLSILGGMDALQTKVRLCSPPCHAISPNLTRLCAQLL